MFKTDMMKTMKPIIPAVACLAISLFFCSCKKPAGESPESPEQGTERVALELTPFGSLNAADTIPLSHKEDWESSKLTLEHRASGFLYKDVITTSYPHYPRMAKMNDGTWIVMCHDENNSTVNGRNVYYATSSDLRNWEKRGALFAEKAVTTSKGVNTKRIYTNGQVLCRRNGEVLAIASYRLDAGYGSVESQQDQGIEMKRSSDCGRTWSEATEIYHGTNWEGMLLELESGQLQCYFSESRPWISGGHSGTGMIFSDDGGLTWSPDRVGNPRTVVREAYVNYQNGKTLYTDQMPAVIKLVGQPGYAGAFEARQNNSSAYGISLAWSNDGLWPELVDSDGSYPVVTEEKCGPEDRQSYAWTGTAPTLMQFPSGETVVGYSARYQGDNHLMFRMGDSGARIFGKAAPALPHKGSWGAVSLVGSHELAAVNRDSFDSGKIGVSYAVYALNHRIAAAAHEVVVDGRNKDWSPDDEALFVGSLQDAQATLRCSSDGKNLYFLIEVTDEQMSAGDFVELLLAPVGTSYMHSNCISVTGSCLKVMPACTYSEDAWKETPSIQSSGFAAFDGTLDDNSDLDNGWLCEISIPVSSVPLFEGKVLVNLCLTKQETGKTDSISPATDASSWLILTAE